MARLLVAAVVCVAIGAGNARASTISTAGSWDGASAILPFGEPHTATYGQTFTAPLDSLLTSFTFFVDDFLDPDVVDFAAYVMAWDGAKATGPILFGSVPMSTTNNGGAGGFETITINTGGVALIPGSQYVAFFSASNFFDGSDGTSRWGYLNADVYAGGGFVFSNNGNNFGLLTTNNWEFVGGGVNDLAFTLEFGAQAVPEPATLTLLGIGLAGAGARRLRGRRNRSL